MTHLCWFPFSKTAIYPTRGTPGSAGYDLYADEDTVIKPQYHGLVQTNIGVIIPQGWYGRIAPRSSVAYKYGIQVFAGVIDSDYRDNLGVILHNSGDQDYVIKKGDRIAQIIIEKCLASTEVLDMKLTYDEATVNRSWNTERKGGFGSTGV